MPVATTNKVRTIPELVELTKLTPEPFISINEALSLMPSMTRNHLAQLRFDGAGPKFYKPTGRTVLYKASEVLGWVEANNCAKTCDSRKAQH